VLGYAGTKDFAAFFTWALANTNLEEMVNAKLDLPKHVKAADRPRMPVGNQTIGTCAICLHAQVVRRTAMVTHGYQRPGHGYIVGECFGVGYHPYELSADACVAYIPHLEAAKTRYETKLAFLNAGKQTQYSTTKRNYRTGQDDITITKIGDPAFAGMLKADIKDTTQQIAFITADIATMQKRITDWKPGTLLRNGS
jgi:hypothetical protein